METTREEMELLGRARFVERIAEMLIDSQAVHPTTERRIVCISVAQTVDEAEQHGIKSERLMGMYVILRLADDIDPYAVPEYATVLQDPKLAEDDKAHLLQMIRLSAI